MSEHIIVPSYWDKTTDPGLTDDKNSSCYVGTWWLNDVASPKKLWVCLDDAVGAAVWKELSFV